MWNRIMMEIGLRIKTYRGEPPTKPFNDYLIPRLFNKLINQLGLSDVSTGELRNQSLTTVKSRDGEPLAAVGIAHIIYSSSKEATLVSQYLDKYGLIFITKVLKTRASRVNVNIIVKKQGLRELSPTDIKQIAMNEGIDADSINLEFTNKPLHAKIYASNNDIFITSANLLKNSLTRNVETGLMIRNQPQHEIETLINELRT
ncbi:phospholipase D-like domain-containing protein [Vulcanisaeta sp. JCM 14467]